jgi:hypothetical protein
MNSEKLGTKNLRNEFHKLGHHNIIEHGMRKATKIEGIDFRGLAFMDAS